VPEYFAPDGTFPDVDLEPVAIPERSTLVSLPPLGGDFGRESLWSYLHRLADAHTVRLLDLVKKIALQHIPNREKTRKCGGFDLRMLVLPLLGPPIAKAVEALTFQPSLVRHTLGPIASLHGLAIAAKEHRSWCPDCLAADVIPFERLAWAVKGLDVCIEHRTRLLDRCPACGVHQGYQNSNADLRTCWSCGASRIAGQQRPDLEEVAEFEFWSAKQIHGLFAVVDDLVPENVSPKLWSRNVQTIADNSEIGGITCLGKILHAGRTSARSWSCSGIGATLPNALRLAWVAGVDLSRLFITELEAHDLRFRPLPEAGPRFLRRPRRPIAPCDTPVLYLATLRCAGRTPFGVPTVAELERESGVHRKHPAFREAAFLRLISSARERAAKFQRKERVWRDVCDIHQAALAVVAESKRPTARNVGGRMRTPATLVGLRARRYLAWLRRRWKAQEPGALLPKIVPMDVRAFWAMQEQRSAENKSEAAK
jgi:hypothetical protein